MDLDKQREQWEKERNIYGLFPAVACAYHLKKAIQNVLRWHEGVVYGGGLVMTDQLVGTACCIRDHYKGYNKNELILAALLSKAWEKKRHNEESKANPVGTTYEELKQDFIGYKVADIVKALSTEPDTKDWNEMAKWASSQTQEVQTILLAEKLQNFKVSRDNPNPKKPAEWHIDYYRTRMIMVEACKQASPELYAACVKVAEEGIERQTKIISRRLVLPHKKVTFIPRWMRDQKSYI